jgi:hypothetical protein
MSSNTSTDNIPLLKEMREATALWEKYLAAVLAQKTTSTKAA